MTTSWKETVLRRLQERGYKDVGDLLRRNQGRTYAELADDLGDAVLPVQLSHLQLEAAKQAGSSAFREAMADALVRSLRDQLPKGWSQSSSDPEISQSFKNGLAFTVWRTHLRPFGVSEAITDILPGFSLTRVYLALGDESVRGRLSTAIGAQAGSPDLNARTGVSLFFAMNPQAEGLDALVNAWRTRSRSLRPATIALVERADLA